MNIRKATQDDAQLLFQIGLDSPELTVSSIEWIRNFLDGDQMELNKWYLALDMFVRR